jgi:hypothetical protein
MEQFIKHFVRQGPGRWGCVQSCTFESAVGRIQVATGTLVMRGVKFMNFDLAEALETEYAKQMREHR